MAQLEEQTITVFAGFGEEILCSYKFEFSVDAGPRDIMTVEIIRAMNAGMTFTVGTNFYSAERGAKLNNPEG